MKKYIGLFLALTLALTACGEVGRVSSAPDPFGITPSRLPRIVTATPNIIGVTSSPSPTGVTLTPTTSLDQSPSSTFTATVDSASPQPPTFTFTPSLPIPTITLLGCETSLDLSHGMGEVTNAYVAIANRFGPNLTAACATLSSSDEGRVHPDKTVCVSSLPWGYQVTFKLTIDTTTQVNTVVDVTLTSGEGVTSRAGGLSCTEIGSFKPPNNALGVVVPIP